MRNDLFGVLEACLLAIRTVGRIWWRKWRPDSWAKMRWKGAR